MIVHACRRRSDGRYCGAAIARGSEQVRLASLPVQGVSERCGRPQVLHDSMADRPNVPCPAAHFAIPAAERSFAPLVDSLVGCPVPYSDQYTLVREKTAPLLTAQRPDLCSNYLHEHHWSQKDVLLDDQFSPFHAALSFSYEIARFSGMQRTCPKVVIKFVSPVQRGTTCTCT